MLTAKSFTFCSNANCFRWRLKRRVCSLEQCFFFAHWKMFLNDFVSTWFRFNSQSKSKSPQFEMSFCCSLLLNYLLSKWNFDVWLTQIFSIKHFPLAWIDFKLILHLIELSFQFVVVVAFFCFFHFIINDSQRFQIEFQVAVDFYPLILLKLPTFIDNHPEIRKRDLDLINGSFLTRSVLILQLTIELKWAKKETKEKRRPNEPVRLLELSIGLMQEDTESGHYTLHWTIRC